MEFRLGFARRPHLQGDAVDEHRFRAIATSISATPRPARRAAFDAAISNGGPFHLQTHHPHDLKARRRWMLEPPEQKQPMDCPPLMRRG